MSTFAAGTTLCNGRYELQEVLGRGGMAIVWRARDLQLERDVAIKVISDVLADDPRFVARFEREARLAAGLSHPNLVRLFDFSVDAERPFLIMEYVPGGTLADARGRALDAEPLARDLLDALAHIHAAGIVHRDIKPANVLLTADGSPKLTDFGIARGEETSGLTQTGQVLGTLRYIAPEVARGEPATPQSDLYALGILLGEIAGVATAPGLGALIRRMSASDPAARPASAGEALAELDPTTLLDPTDETIRIPEPSASEKPAFQTGGLPPYTGVTKPSQRGQPPWLGRGISLRAALVSAVLLFAVLLVVVVAALSGGDSTSTTTRRGPSPAAAGAPVSQQLDRLEQIVRSAPKR